MEQETTEKKSTAGELLRQGRLRQRLSVVECAKRTHIASRYLEALEEERWKDLPSESHRLGFLKLYARFLGVSVDDVMSAYRQRLEDVKAQTSVSSAPAGIETAKKLMPIKKSAGWSAPTWAQLLGASIVLLMLVWFVYHALDKEIGDSNFIPNTHRHQSQQARLVAPKPTRTNQKIHIKAEADSWLRVVVQEELLFEGILPAGGSKEWSGQGPFRLKIGNVRALNLTWNDQPVDITEGARGGMNDIQIPPK